MGGYDGQTLAGIMMTATHGSGLAYGPVADAVVSLQMVVDGGKMVQIEPSNGITNPATFTGRLEEDANIRVQLIQDDDAFNAARISLGSMGVVYAITLKTDQKFPAIYVHQNQYLTTQLVFVFLLKVDISSTNKST